MRTHLLITIVIMLVGLGGGFMYLTNTGTSVIWGLVQPTLPSETSSRIVTFDEFSRDNEAYRRGVAAEQAAAYVDAQRAYAEALTEAPNTAITSRVAVRHAFVTGFIDPRQAITLLHAIATNPEYQGEVRADAYEYVLHTYFIANTADLATHIFSDKAFQEFAPSGQSTYVLFVPIAEYVNTLGTRPLLHAYLAMYHAREARLLAEGVATRNEHIQAARDYSRTAAVAITAMSQPGEIQHTIAMAKMFLAEASAFTTIAGEPISEYTSAYEDAIAYVTVGDTETDLFPRFRYAQFSYVIESDKAATRADEILASVYTQYAQHPAFVAFLTRERENIYQEKTYIVRMANAIPKLKTLLQTLGWTESDFKLTS